MILNENFSVTLPVSGIEYVISVLRVSMCDIYMLSQPKGVQNHKPLEAHNLITHVYITYICTLVGVCVSACGLCLIFSCCFLSDSSVSTKAQVIAVK